MKGNENIIEQHIKIMYPNWLQQSERMCTIQGIHNEAEDVLQEVICYVLEHYKARINELYQCQKGNYNALDGLIISILKKNIHSATAPYHQKYLKNCPPLDRNTELYELQLVEEEKNIDPWILFNKALKRLHLPEKELEIFYHYYIKQKKLCDWNGPESISKLSRICKHIIEHLKKEIKKTS